MTAEEFAKASGKSVAEVEKEVQKTVDNSAESGIMKSGNKLTKLSDKGEVLNPMDSSVYKKMKQGLEKQGYSVISATKEDDIRYLKAFGAEAISDEIGILHLGEVPSASAFFEEIIHLKQIEKYGSLTESDFVERAAREIAANRMLLKNAKAYGFTNDDIVDITTNLKKWEDDFKKKAGVLYDESKISRGI